MKGRICRCRAAVAAGVLLVSSPLRPTLAGQHRQDVAFTEPWTGAVVVPVTVNGTGPYSFLIDTGSSHTAVTTSVAAVVTAPRVARTQLSSASGDGWVAVVRLGRMAVAEVEFQDVLATELPAVQFVDGQTIDGIIGRDLLEQRPFTIDYRRHVFGWSAEPDGAGTSLALDESGPVWLVTLNAADRPMRLVPDSGATGLVVFDRGQWRGLRYLGGTTGVETVTSRTAGRRGTLSQLNIGTARVVNQEVTVMDGAQVSDAHGDGLLPLHWFDSVSVDTARGRLFITQTSSRHLLASARREPGVQTE